MNTRKQHWSHQKLQINTSAQCYYYHHYARASPRDWCRSGEFFWKWWVGVANVGLQVQQQPGCKCFFLQCSPFTCLLFTNDPIRIWSRCVRKWFLFPIHAGLLTIIRKRLQGKKFTNSIHSKHYFWFTGGSAPDPHYRLALRARHESYSRLLSTPLFSTWRRSCCYACKDQNYAFAKMLQGHCATRWCPRAKMKRMKSLFASTVTLTFDLFTSKPKLTTLHNPNASDYDFIRLWTMAPSTNSLINRL